MINQILDWIMPITCTICGFRSETEICHPCRQDLPWLINPCQLCGNELQAGSTVKECGECLIEPPPFDFVFILFRYSFPVRSIIQKLKFQQKLFYANPLGNLMAEHLSVDYRVHDKNLPQCIIPVPLHSKRLRMRGYNQAMEIARPLKKRLGIPIHYNVMERIIATQPQTFLSATERQQNVKNAFRLCSEIDYQHVAIVDDVVTTFSTLSEVSKLLRKQGVQIIDVWCIAKA